MGSAQVDVFISHSWSAGRWGKSLALCFYLNTAFAVKSGLASAIVGPIVLALIADVNNLASSPWLFPLTVDLPILAFFLSFLFGHGVCSRRSPTIWLDALCIPQTDEERKQEAISMLPAFVTRSSQMVILWDDTYCSRLWCAMELALFLKKASVSRLRIVPLWLVPWLLGTMLLDWFCVRLTLPLIYVAWSQHMTHGHMSRLETVSQVTILWGFILVAYLPALIPAIASFVMKIRHHEAMLQQLQSFNIQAAKCSVEQDRELLQALIARVYDEVDASPISVAFGAEEDFLPDPCSDVLLPGRQGVRDPLVLSITSYPNFEESLELFHQDVRGQLFDAMTRDLGSVTRLPLGMCALALLPTFVWSLSTAFVACDGLPCDRAAEMQGYQSSAAMWTYDGLGLLLIVWPGFLSMFPLLLHVLRAAISATAGLPCSWTLVWLSALGLYFYAFSLMGVANGLLLVAITEPASALWLAGLAAVLLLLTLQWTFCFTESPAPSAGGPFSCRGLCRKDAL